MIPGTDCDKDPIPNGKAAKTLGAFYTDAQIADFLVAWAVRTPQDTVMDPSFGGGVFLRSASRRLVQLGGQPGAQVFGVELDSDVHARTAEKLGAEFGVRRQNLLPADFFGLNAATASRVEVVVGNPPFIRYQRFTGKVRDLALRRTIAQGVNLPELCSSWAPFVVHSIAMLRPGGRLAMVVPMEIGHARYALPVLRHLRRSFGKVGFLTFRKKLFPDLSEDTLLLLAEEKGQSSASFWLQDLTSVALLPTVNTSEPRPDASQPLDAEAISCGRERLIEHLIPAGARTLYRELKDSPAAPRLGDLADVGIGYVTGANEFFHIRPDEARRRGIPRRFLKPAIRRGRSLAGLRFTDADWQAAVTNGQAGYLFHIQQEDNLPESVREYIRHGELQGIPKAYKCRTRSPWFRVPHVYRPDAFLSYMSGATPRLVANDADVVAPNSLHIVRLHPHARLTSDGLAALWQTSLTRLSVEIEGHALGGGMLKLEPTEAENALVALPPDESTSWLGELAAELDAMERNAGNGAVQGKADEAILQQRLGLSRGDIRLLQEAADLLRARRYSRDTPA